MKYSLFFLLLFLAFTACEDPQAEELKTDFSLLDLEQLLYELVNDHRAGRELPLLKWDDYIAQSARSHSQNMMLGLVPFGHDGFGVRIDSIEAHFSTVRASGENVAMNYDGQDKAFEQWKNSMGHRENMEGDYTHTGVGIARDTITGVFFFTQIFIRK